MARLRRLRTTSRAGNQTTDKSHRGLRASFWRSLIFMIGVNCLGGCGTLPDSYALMHDRRMYRRHFKVVSSQGPLSARESKLIIKNLEARSGKTDILRRHPASAQATSGTS